MNDLIEKLKSLNNATQAQFNEVIASYSHEQVMKDLERAGLKYEDLSKEEFNILLNQKIEQSKSFSKGAMVAGGLFMFLEFLG